MTTALSSFTSNEWRSIYCSSSSWLRRCLLSQAMNEDLYTALQVVDYGVVFFHKQWMGTYMLLFKYLTSAFSSFTSTEWRSIYCSSSSWLRRCLLSQALNEDLYTALQVVDYRVVFFHKHWMKIYCSSSTWLRRSLLSQALNEDLYTALQVVDYGVVFFHKQWMGIYMLLFKYLTAAFSSFTSTEWRSIYCSSSSWLRRCLLSQALNEDLLLFKYLTAALSSFTSTEWRSIYCSSSSWLRRCLLSQALNEDLYTALQVVDYGVVFFHKHWMKIYILLFK